MLGMFMDSNNLIQPSIPLKKINKSFFFYHSVVLPPIFLTNTPDKNIFKVTSNSNLPLSKLWFSFALIETNEPSAINLYASRTEPFFHTRYSRLTSLTGT